MIKEFLRYNYNERKGILYLAALLLIMIVIYTWITYYPVRNEFVITAMENKIDSSAISLTEDVSRITPIEIPSFNPNEVNRSQLVSWGVSEKTASIWMKYLSKGGKFKHAEDIGKIYGLREDIKQTLMSHINFPSPPSAISVSQDPIRLSKTIEPIDPNLAGLHSLIDIGIPKYTASHLINYRSKGAYFHTLSDLSQVYGMNDSLLQEISPYLSFNPDPNKDSTKSDAPFLEASKPKAIIKPEKIILPFDINTCDTNTLKSLSGIGSVLAKRIVAYRERLGGYYSLEQLHEVYGLPDTTFNKIQSKILLRTPIHKLKINLDSLLYHPYIPPKIAKIILNYRSNHGPFTNIESLAQIRAIDDVLIRKISPYLDFSK